MTLRDFIRELWDFCGALIAILLLLFFLDIGFIAYWEFFAK